MKKSSPAKFRYVSDVRKGYPKRIDFEKTVGSTTYAVSSSFNKDAGEDIFSKVRRRILSK